MPAHVAGEFRTARIKPKKETPMSNPSPTLTAAQLIATATLGAAVTFSNGTPKPPTRFKRKLADWESRNGVGMLTEKSDHMFTLHMGRIGGMIEFFKTFGAESPSTRFHVAAPAPGQIRILTRYGDLPTLIHLAASQSDAEAWLKAHPNPDASFETVAAEAA